MPGLFKAAGILLPLGYGQGPGQANNTGSSYEALGFVGGRSFGLAIAAAGYISACVVGVIYINYLVKKKKISIKEHDDISGSVTVDYFQNKNELPISESLDKFSIQLALVLLVYTVTFLTTWGLTSLLSAISESLGNSLNSLLWGFNFMIGSGMAILFRSLLSLLYKKGIVKHQYQNNYLLNRIAGLAFDVMIVAGIAFYNMYKYHVEYCSALGSEKAKQIFILGSVAYWFFIGLGIVLYYLLDFKFPSFITIFASFLPKYICDNKYAIKLRKNKKL